MQTLDGYRERSALCSLRLLSYGSKANESAKTTT